MNQGLAECLERALRTALASVGAADELILRGFDRPLLDEKLKESLFPITLHTLHIEIEDEPLQL